ncbi:MAG: PASTA domain-containing protein [Oscillospiraceae bacterium]|nr:PASTA domain-containing protein [Oscillospiraceae bacterium]
MDDIIFTPAAVAFVILAAIALASALTFGFVLFTSKKEKRELMKKTKIAALISVVLVPIMICGIFYNLQVSVCGGVPNDVPDLKGLDYEMCSESYADFFTLTIEAYEYSEYPEGTIIHQNLPAGQRHFDYGYEIKCVVSKGMRQITIPNIVGTEFDWAAEYLAAEHGSDIEIESEEYSDEYDEGEIISQNPVGNEQADYGSTVKVVVSKGKVPDETE